MVRFLINNITTYIRVVALVRTGDVPSLSFCPYLAIVLRGSRLLEITLLLNFTISTVTRQLIETTNSW